MSTPICTRCYQQYSESNPARILNKCAHSFCSNCIMGFKVCPVDNYPVDSSKNKLQSFRINTAIMRDMMRKEPIVRKSVNIGSPPLSIARKSSNREEESYRCLLHDKPLDLVCIDHLKRICSGCALFGDHKLHKVETIEKVLADCSFIGEHALNTLSQLVSKEQYLSESAIIQSVAISIKQKRDFMVKNIRSKFKKFIDRFKKLQMQTLQKLDKMAEIQRDQLISDIKLQEILSKKTVWMNEAKKLIDLVEKLTNDRYAEQAARYLNEHCQQSSVAHRGDYLLVQISSFETTMANKLEKSKQDMIVEFDDTLQQKLSNYATICRLTDKQKKVVSEQKRGQVMGDVYLLEEGLTIENKQDDGLTPDTCETFRHINQLMMGEAQPFSTNNFIEPEVTQIIEVRQADILLRSQSQSISVADLRRKKKIKVPEKYEQTIEDLRNDRCDTIDLGGAQLGDAIVIALCDYIRCSQRLRSLKLVRNKLTNDSLQPIIEACTEANIVSLNLGQNLMTQRALQILEKIQLKELKAITLSQNKIKERICKTKLAQFKKKGITISI